MVTTVERALKKYYVKVWSGLNWLTTESNVGLLRIWWYHRVT